MTLILALHLVRTFHMTLFFWRCHVDFFTWCYHMAWFHWLIIHIINWRLIWSQIFDHEQSDGCEYIIKFWCLQMPPLQDLASCMIVMHETRIEVHRLLDWFLFLTFFLFYFIYKWALICLHDRFVLNGNTTYVVPFFQL